MRRVQRVEDMRRNVLVAGEVAEEENCFVLVVVVVVGAVEALDQVVIRIDMEKNCMIGKNYREKVIVELGLVNKVMEVVVVAAVVV